MTKRDAFIVPAQEWKHGNRRPNRRYDKDQFHQRSQDHLVRVCSPIIQVTGIFDNRTVKNKRKD
ncbi:hypothetical protein D3C80_2233870 [compost metagenome]